MRAITRAGSKVPIPGESREVPKPARTLSSLLTNSWNARRSHPIHRSGYTRGVVRLGLAGDTMLGRLVAERLASDGAARLFAPEVVDAAAEADLFVLNLECCISERGVRWPAPGKPFFFRAPPVAVEALLALGVDCVTLANNHALDYGEDALADTLRVLADAGISAVGAGTDVDAARAPAILEHDAFRLAVLGVTDHPADFAAGADRPGVAFADLWRDVPGWLLAAVDETSAIADAVLVTPHWGPNMVPAPLPHVRLAASRLRDAGATLVTGHSAHVFHGVDDHVLYDLGDFIDDYAVDRELRNDLGLLWFVDLDDAGAPTRLEAVPLLLDFCYTGVATGDDARWIGDRFRAACSEFGTTVDERDGRLVVEWC
jgi:poly-gamma-glutamate capsule biosynthesis protein CapA/YwtB (metallophosphatase superfamily)